MAKYMVRHRRKRLKLCFKSYTPAYSTSLLSLHLIHLSSPLHLLPIPRCTLDECLQMGNDTFCEEEYRLIKCYFVTRIWYIGW
jgi:hypothetical protein